MKNIPTKIYLQVGEDCPPDADFSELTDVTWSSDKINENDIEFILTAGSYISRVNYNIIIQIILGYYNVSNEELKEKTRETRIRLARQVIHYFLSKHTKLSLTSIGRIAGNKHHATVLHSKRVIKNESDTNKEFAQELNYLDEKIKASI